MDSGPDTEKSVTLGNQRRLDATKKHSPIANPASRLVETKSYLVMPDESRIVEIFTDGACSGNPGPGGYGAVLKYGQNVKEISGCEPHTTNNRMEMMAVIQSLRQLKRPCKIRLITDSNYVVKGMTQWVHGWIRRNWVNSQKRPVLNRELWEEILELSRKHQITWKWVKGHDGHPENERCDQLAREAMKNCQKRWGVFKADVEKDILKTLGKMTYGIYILTTFHEEKVNGMVASWVSQISHAPHLVMVAVHPNRYSHSLIQKNGYYALHVLAQNQIDLLERFKAPDSTAKFDSISWDKGKMGCPILSSCLAYMECQVTAIYAPGNHTLFVGEVKDAQTLSDGIPLSTLDYAGTYLGKDWQCD
jgi:ribonuclease HI